MTTINVTETHIKDAKLKRSYGLKDYKYCPIALAAKEAFNAWDVKVDYNLDPFPAPWSIIEIVEDSGYKVIYSMPQVAVDFARAFDKREDVEPLTFTPRFVNRVPFGLPD